MTITGLPTSFADVTYADLINLSSPWLTETTTNKGNALQYARMYLSRTYSFNFVVTAPPDAVKTAESWLGNYHLTEDLFITARNAAPQKGLTEKSVEAKGLKSSKKYDTNKSNSWVDPFPEVTALLLIDGVCTLAKITGGISFVGLARA